MIAPDNSSTKTSSRPATLSERVLGLVWKPLDLDGVVCAVEDSSTLLSFVRDHFGNIFGSGGAPGRFFEEGMTDAKRRFIDEMDAFVFRTADGRAVGAALGHPTDWSSYYFRSIALLPEAQSRGTASRFLRRANEALRDAGVTRSEAEVSPANAPSLRLALAAGFVVTGSVMSERWGYMLHITNHLDEDARRVFHHQFSSMNIPTTPRRTP